MAINTATSSSDANTIQSSIKHNEDDSMENYALFLGGVNATHAALQHYDPLKTGYGRLFCVHPPAFVYHGIPKKWSKFKHILEYANTAVGGINNVSMQFNNLTGGYAGKQFEIPSHLEDGTNSFNVKVYEFSGSPVREVIHYWLNGIADLNTGLCHYNGVTTATGATNSEINKIARCQANQTAEFIYVSTDNTGEAAEYVCLLANCIPKEIVNDHWNYNSGEHSLVDLTIEFTCTKYESIQINAVGQALLNKYRVLTNSMNFYSGYKVSEITSDNQDGDVGIAYNPNNGQITSDFVSASNVEHNTPRPSISIGNSVDAVTSGRITYSD